MTCSYITIISNKKYVIFIEVDIGTWSVLLGKKGQYVFIEIPETVTLVINWWAVPLESLYLIGLP